MVDNFIPTSCTNVHCDVKSMSVLMDDGSSSPHPPRDGSAQGHMLHRHQDQAGDQRPLALIDEGMDGQEGGEGTWADFIQRARTNYLTISSMPFQDVWNVETERLKGCCIHTVTPDGRLIPFCLFNINSVHGKTLYRHEILEKYATKG